jgi:hypothetical protein
MSDPQQKSGNTSNECNTTSIGGVPLTSVNSNVESNVCCEFFIETLNNKSFLAQINNKNDRNNLILPLFKTGDNKQSLLENELNKLDCNNDLTIADVVSFINYCHLWQQK